MSNNQPIFRSIFGNSWQALPTVMHKHYANRPYSDDLVIVKGKMDIECGKLGKLLMPLFRIFGTLVPYQGKDIDVTVNYRSSVGNACFYLDRVFNFDGKKPFHFRSRMVQIKNEQVIEFMRFGLGWCMRYIYEDGLVKLKHKCYILRVFGINIKLPLSFVIGKGYAEEKAISDDEFSMLMTINHPLWGIIYQYKGKFRVIN